MLYDMWICLKTMQIAKGCYRHYYNYTSYTIDQRIREWPSLTVSHINIKLFVLIIWVMLKLMKICIDIYLQYTYMYCILILCIYVCIHMTVTFQRNQRDDEICVHMQISKIYFIWRIVLYYYRTANINLRSIRIWMIGDSLMTLSQPLKLYSHSNANRSCIWAPSVLQWMKNLSLMSSRINRYIDICDMLCIPFYAAFQSSRHEACFVFIILRVII